jgi:UDP-N-acetylmuramyl pentapeptide phosphotransferase/UDP-N-acetylglucosamine-1-phosphate transferase
MPPGRPDRSVAGLLLVVPVVVLLVLGLVLVQRGDTSRDVLFLALVAPAAALSVWNWRRDFRG